MKQNDWIALNLNIEGTNIDINNLRLYNITPDNTDLRDIDYYKNIPQVKERFSDTNGVFDDDAFTSFYDSAKRSYNTFASDEYIKNLINDIPSSRNDIFSLGNTNIYDDTAYIIASHDPQRHTVGIGNIFEAGAPVFSEREVAQANKVTDEQGNVLDWAPNDKGGLIKALFRPTLTLAQYDKDEYDESGNIIHYKGERKYNEFGDPYYEILGNREIYGRDVLKYADTLTKEGSWANKIDIFDKDGIKTSIGQTLLHATAKILPYLTPYGYWFGALEAAIALGQTIPVLTKMINGVFTNDSNDGIGETATSVENWFNRFGHTQSDYQRAHRWGLEGVAEMVLDSAGQLYSQRLIQKIPAKIAKWRGTTLSVEGMKRAQALSSAYMATTSAKDVYGEYKQAGLNDAMSGIGSFATMLAYFTFMQNSYFKDMLFRDSAIELPELKILLNKATSASTKELAAQQAAKTGITAALKTSKEAVKKEGEKQWFLNAYLTTTNALKKVLPTLKNITSAASPYLYTSRAFNEGVEEVMEEAVSDFFKGMTLGLNAMGINVKSPDIDKIDFGFSPQNFLERYATAFVGGAIGGTVFEGLTQWDNKILNRNISRVSDLSDVDEQLSWYIRNGYGEELLKIINQWERKGKFGSKDLSWNYKIEDGKIVYDAAKGDNNQNTGIANILRQRIRYKAAQLEALGLNITDNEILLKAVQKIDEEAERAGYKDVTKYQEEKLRDARIDFLKETGVDKFIISDIADYQKKLSDLEESIEEKRKELNNVPDKLKSQVEDTEEIKRLQKQYDSIKKELDDILSGKATSKYLSEGIFTANQTLVNLYTSELDGKNDTWFEKQVENFTRAMYGENYSELTNAEKELLKAEYYAWKDLPNRKDRIRHAFKIHQHLTNLITPVVEQQVKDYYGYKTEDARQPVIKANLEAIFQQRINFLENQIKNLVENNGDPEEVVKLSEDLRIVQESLERNRKPQSVLDTSLLPENEENIPKVLTELNDAKDISMILPALVGYYTDLNNGKIVSEFSDDILKDGLDAIGKLSKTNYIQNYTTYRSNIGNLANSFEEGLEQLVLDQRARPELNSSKHLIKNSNADEENKSESQILQELYNAWIEDLHNDGIGIFTYNGKTKHFTEHLKDQELFSKLSTIQTVQDIDEETGEPIEIQISVNPFDKFISYYNQAINDHKLIFDKDAIKKLDSLVDDFSKSFTKGFDSIKSSYNKLFEYVTQLNNAHLINVPSIEGFINSWLFNNDNSVFSSLDQLKQLRAERIKTPILEWIQALSMDVNGMPTNIWQMLQNEIKELESKDLLEQYVISDPFALQELNFLEGALTATRAIALGMLPGQTNAQINKIRSEDKLEPLFVFDNDDLADVYNNDISVIQQRVEFLLNLHNMNFAGTVRQKKQSMVVNAPLIVKALFKTSTGVNEEDPQLFIAGKLKEIGIDDIHQLWIDSGGTDAMLDEVTESNFNEFWNIYRTFQNNIYDKVFAFTPTTSIDKTTIIAKTLVSGFTELWKFKMSNLTHQKETTRLENIDVLMWLASTIAVDPRTTNGLIKTVRSSTQVSPFFDQLLGIQSGFATLENSKLFDAIVDEIYNSQKEAVNKLNLTKKQKDFLNNKSRIKQAIFIDGSAGTGKSQVVLRYIREMRKLLHPNIAAVAVSEYEERTKTLKTALNITDADTYIKHTLIEKILGRSLKTDDYNPITEENINEETHYRTLKDSVKEEIRKKEERWKEILNGREGLDVYIDESGFLSEADFQFFSEAASKNIHFIYAGDKMQNGCIVTLPKGQTNSGIFDIIGLTTPRLDLSMRAGNLGMVKNLQYLEKLLRLYLNIYQNEPWTSVEDLTQAVESKYGVIGSHKFSFYEDENSLFGIANTSDPIQSLSKLKRLIENTNKKIVIITDNLDKWKSERSSNIDVLDIKQVQGGEYDYALIDVQNFGKSKTFDYIRNIYTLISRAKTGVYVNGEFGEMFPKNDEMDNTASIIVNKAATSGEDDTALLDYNDFFKDLYENETWSSINPSTVSTSPTPTGTTGQITITTTPGIVSSPEKKSPGLSDFNMDDFLESIKKDGLKSPYLREWYSKTKNKDYENYQQYSKEIDTNGNNGSLLVTKDFIKWLFLPDSDSIIFPTDTTHSILTGFMIPNENRIEYKRAIRNMAMDLFVLSKEELSKKYGNDSTSPYMNQWMKILNNKKFNDRVEELLKELPNAKDEEGNIELYSVRDGEYCYLYYVSNKGFTIPVGRVKNLNIEGGIKIKPTQITPLIMISTNGKQFKPIDKVVGEYAELDDHAYIIKVDDPKKLSIAEDSGVEGFIYGNLGKPQALISVTHADGNVNPVMSARKNKDDQLIGIDSTHSYDGKKRLNAVAQWVSLSQWMHLTSIVDKLRKNENPDTSELKKYLSNKQTEFVDLVQNNPNVSELFYALGGLSILSNDSRKLLTTALFRYFSSLGYNNTDSQKFLNNLFKWNAVEYQSTIDGETYKRQKGFSFTIDGIGSSEEYHILDNGKGGFRVLTFTKDNDIVVESEIGTLSAEEWLNIQNPNPINMARNILALAKSNRAILSEDNISLWDEDSILGNYFTNPDVNLNDSEIDSLLKDGILSICITTRSQAIKTDDDTIKRNTVKYFSPFDTEILDLLNEINVDPEGELEQFLKTDSKFKYQFLVNTPGEDWNENPYWLRTKDNPKNLLTDLGLILPPLFNISGQIVASDNHKFTTLGLLGHKSETSDLSQVTISEKINDSGEVIEYQFNDKKVVLPVPIVKEFIPDLNVTTPVITILSATPTTLTVQVNGGNMQYNVKSGKDVKDLFNGAKFERSNINNNTTIIKNNLGWTVFKNNKDGKLKISNGNRTFTPKLLFENDSILALWISKQYGPILFSKSNSEVIGESLDKLIDGEYIGRDKLDENNSQEYFISDNNVKCLDVDGNVIVYTNVQIGKAWDDGVEKDVLIGTYASERVEITRNNDIVRNAKQNGIKSLPKQKKSDERIAIEKISKNKSGLTQIEGRLTKKRLDNWARENAILLGGLFSYNEKFKEFEELNDEQSILLYTFANWMQENEGKDAQEIINMNPSLVVVGNENDALRKVNISLQDETFTFNFSMNPEGSIIFTQVLNTDENQVVLSVSDIVNNLDESKRAVITNEDIKFLNLFAQALINTDVNTNFPEFNNWLQNLSVEAKQLIDQIYNIVDKAQTNESCIIFKS